MRACAALCVHACQSQCVRKKSLGAGGGGGRGVSASLGTGGGGGQGAEEGWRGVSVSPHS